MIRPHGKPAAFSLIELMLVIVVMSLAATLLIPNTNASVGQQLTSAARIAAADLEYARSLALTHNSTYQVEFQANRQQYVIEHSGADSSLDTLPNSPFRSSSDPAHQQITGLTSLSGLSLPVSISAMVSGTGDPVATVEFGPLGETTRSETTTIWLSAGNSDATRYISISINPTTGTVTLGETQSRLDVVIESDKEVSVAPL